MDLKDLKTHLCDGCYKEHLIDLTRDLKSQGWTLHKYGLRGTKKFILYDECEERFAKIWEEAS